MGGREGGNEGKIKIMEAALSGEDCEVNAILLGSKYTTANANCEASTWFGREGLKTDWRRRHG